jgi:hypothetical protein
MVSNCQRQWGRRLQSIAEQGPFWWDAIGKEIRNVKVAFEFSNNPNLLVGYATAICHLMFDIKFN